jgi:hypothetical protein
VRITHKRTLKKSKPKHTGSTARTSNTGTVTGNAVLAALMNDPNAMSQLMQALAGSLLSSGFTAEIIEAIESIVNTSSATTPGHLVAGTVSTLTGALQLNGSSVPDVAMVFLNGAATAVPCYIPTHIRSQIATGQEVWVMPVNGSYADLMVFSIRNVF